MISSIESQDNPLNETQNLTACAVECCCITPDLIEETNCCEVEETPMSDDSPKKEKKNSPHLDLFLTELEKQETPETKLQLTMDFMEAALAQPGSPHFKSFWDARTICLQLFKENISAILRSQMWTKYTELSKEARRLKEILDEQSTFAAEQIEIAIKALEEDLTNIEKHLETAPGVDFGIRAQSLNEKYDFYENVQRELNLLNAQAGRINSLRKELIRTEMRIKIKNKFFQRLSAVGDKVFPRRKDLIRDVSEHFSADVDGFIAEHFVSNQVEDALFFLREEIKSLQGLAKLLTLNTHAFTHTRMRLSECWDKLKLVDKERKKERAHQKVVFKQNADSVLEKIKAFSESFESGALSVNESHKAIEEISSYMRSVELGRDEVKSLRDELNQARKPLFEKAKMAEEEKQHNELERERQKKAKIDDLRSWLQEFVKDCSNYDADKIVLERDQALEKIASLSLTKNEKVEMEKLLKPLKDLISDKKEQALMTLSDDDKQALQQLQEVLSQRKERRQESKNLLDLYRKSSGSSGFDFQQAMKLNEQINEEKERFAKLDQNVKEIEKKIKELQDKVL